MTESLIEIGVIGDRDPGYPPHRATNEGIDHAATQLEINCRVTWLETPWLARGPGEVGNRFHALWCAPGSPYRSLTGAVNGIRYARENRVPFIGTCGGFQHVVIEYARNVLGFTEAQHAEYDPYASELFISELSCSPAGKPMSVHIDADSRAHDAYEEERVREQYYCNFGLNPSHEVSIEDGGLRIVGRDHNGEARILELPGHPFFVATLFVPQMRSTESSPHPLILSFLRAALMRARATQENLIS